MEMSVEERKAKKWVLAFLCLLVAGLTLLGGLTVFFDPYFHFHGMLPFLQYPLTDERYQNNGILRHFDYDAIITGSSMTECFKTSELDALFGVTSVKVPFSGGSFKEIGDVIRDAGRYCKDLRMVVRGLDYNRMFNHKDERDYTDDNYPNYLYDDNIWNDVRYIWNKDVLINATYDVFGYTRSGKKTISFDQYMNWSDYSDYGMEAILGKYYNPDQLEIPENNAEITAEDLDRIRGNVLQNITDIADELPETEFYCFFTPYSILYFDYYYRTKELDRQLAGEKYMIELLLEHPNIHVFSFFLQKDYICDLNWYKDPGHYHEDMNSQILKWMAEGTGELTKDNYETYCKAEREFFESYDYDALFVPASNETR